MSSTVFVTTVIGVLVANVAVVFAIVWFLASRIEVRIDRLEDRVGHLEEVVQGLREDVAVLKATH